MSISLFRKLLPQVVKVSCLMAVAMAVLALSAVCGSASGAELDVWNYDVLANAERFERGDELQPIRIAGTRNGTFSGCVAVESSKAIKGLRASVGALKSADGATIAAENIKVRYAVAWDSSFNKYRPAGLDVLLEEPPAEIKPQDKRALAGVWVTVDVPESAAAGEYRGELTISAEGAAEQTVAVELSVAEWVIPQTQQWRTWIELLQSPDTLALEYEVPLWSERHWELIARSMEQIGDLGSRVVYIPLISQTNQGNEQSMVRWIRDADGKWRHDYSVMERYLDLAEKHMGKPKMVVLYAWDIYLTTKEKRPTVNPKTSEYSQQQQRLAQRRWDESNKGMLVSVLDEKTGEVTSEYLPHYTAEESREPWTAVFKEVMERLKARGLDDVAVLGMANDEIPSREDVTFLNEISGGLPWIAHLHPPRTQDRKPDHKLFYGIAKVVYEAHVYRIRYEPNPSKKRSYGWKIPEHRAFFGRHGIPNGAALRVRQLPELNITGGQRGVGRVGADFWYVLKNGRGQRSGAVYSRYPLNMWRNLNIDSWLLAPGGNGPIVTARYENMREGVQECEARIFIESVLLDEQKVERIGADLARRAQEVLDERVRAMWRSVWTNEEQLAMLDSISARNAQEAIWQALVRKGVKLPGFWDGEARAMRSREYAKGEQWFIKSGWQKRNADLYQCAAEIQKKL